MIYTVECSFADPAYEAEWNDFYSLSKLPALISVTGFHTSQRFKAVGSGCPVYLALHTIDGLDVLTGAEYQVKGGGNFARWQRHITDWHRNLYDGLDRAPAVTSGELLVVCQGDAEPLLKAGIALFPMHAVALEKFPEHRWIGALDQQSARAAARLSSQVQLYAPMTPQLRSAHIAVPAE
jgi:hypothetical protein